VGSGTASDCRAVPDCGAKFGSGLETVCVLGSGCDTEAVLEIGSGGRTDSDGDAGGLIAGRGSEKLVR
jgi:hypothetical protein